MNNEPLDIFPEVPVDKLYTDESIRAATFFGGLLIGGYLIAENYKHLGERDKVKTTWFITIVATIIIFFIAFSLPVGFPPYIIPIIYSLVTFVLVQRLQGTKIKAHIAAGGKTWSVWRAIGISMIGLAITFAIVFGGFMLMDQYFAPR